MLLARPVRLTEHVAVEGAALEHYPGMGLNLNPSAAAEAARDGRAPFHLSYARSSEIRSKTRATMRLQRSPRKGKAWGDSASTRERSSRRNISRARKKRVFTVS